MNHFAKIAEKAVRLGAGRYVADLRGHRFYASGFHSTGTDGVGPW